MPIFVYRCECGHRFERLVPRDADAPECPECGSETRKIPAGPSLSRLGSSGPARTGPTRTSAARSDVPIPWRGVVSGGPEKLQREIAFRERMEAKALGGLRVPGGPDSYHDKRSAGSSSGDASSTPPASD